MKKILIVDDEAKLVKSMKTFFSLKGVNAEVALSGEEALSILKEKDKEEFSLMITDVVMPHMNGKELNQSVTKARPDIKTLFMSGYTNDVLSKHGMLDTGVTLIDKPFTTDTLANKIRSLLDG